MKGKIPALCNKTLSTLINEFPELERQRARTIDKEIKLYLSKETAHSEIVKEELNKVVTVKTDDFESKCSKLAAAYLENDQRTIFNDGVFCFDAYLFTLISSVLCIYVSNEKYLYFFELITLILLVVIGEFMIKRNRRFFRPFIEAFNKAAPGATIATCLFFILSKVLYVKNCVLLLFLLFPLALTVILTIVEIKK